MVLLYIMLMPLYKQISVGMMYMHNVCISSYHTVFYEPQYVLVCIRQVSQGSSCSITDYISNIPG